ncbi:MAG TPA: winged helix-turn-helix domain-containing protein [Aggregatilineales bacterium]|nr:winged helix-turn-helix domain-containing protein [Anaerolineales bacterium]HRE49219.1 winged helix-turn-helix domain-containing protein [Aggregatilineales bacterium]
MRTLHGTLEIDLAAYRLTRNGVPIRLTKTEWALLAVFLKHHGQVLSHRTLLQHVWGDMYGDESEYVHTYVRRLRRKIEDDPANPEYLCTEMGIGYRLELPLSAAPPPEPSTEAAQPPPRILWVNALPQAVGERYVGRAEAQRHLRTVIHEGARLISLYGRAGVGKTALVCKVLGDLERESAEIAGVVVLTPTGTGITLQRIIDDFRLIISPTARAALDAALTDSLSAAQRVTVFLDSLEGKPYLLYLDNLESYQHSATGEFHDPDLAIFFEIVLEQGSSLQVVITSRYPLALPRTVKAWERVIALEEGLPPAESVELLRRADPDGAAGVRDAHPDVLERLAGLAQGYPRALVALVGLLLEDSLLTVSDVLSDDSFLRGEMASLLVEGAIRALIDHAPELGQVLAAAAVLNRPAPKAAFEYLLAPFLDPKIIHQSLNRLVRSYFLNYQERLFSLHPLDRAFLYEQLPQGAASDAPAAFTRRTLHARAAEYAHIHGDDSEERARAAFDHYLSAGSNAAAAALLAEIDSGYSLRGRDSDLREMYEALRPHGGDLDPALGRFLTLRLGKVYRRMGRTRDAIACYEDAGERARQQGSPRDEEKALNSLGWAYYDLGLFRQARHYLGESLTLAEALNDAVAQGKTHSGLGWVAYLRGQYDEAIRRFEAALSLYRAMPPDFQDDGFEPVIGMGMNWGDLGEVYAAVGDYPRAIDLLRESRAIAERLGLRREQSYKGGYLAKAFLWAGAFDEALEAASAARAAAIYGNDHVTAVLYGIIVARLGRGEEALAAFQEGAHQAKRLLGYTYGLYHARYTLALANAGIYHLTGEMPYAEAALRDAQIALSICAEDGVRAVQQRLWESLRAAAGVGDMAALQADAGL